jgi:putative flippase GtrA
LIRLLPVRHHNLARELLTFGLVGAFNTALSFAIFNLILGIGALSANAVSTAIATGCSFVLNRNVTYRHRPRTSLRRELPMFAALNLIALGLQQAIMALGKVTLSVHDTDRLELNGVRVFAVAISTVFLLLTYRNLVFKKAVPDRFVELTAPLDAEIEAELIVAGAQVEVDTEALVPTPVAEPARRLRAVS